MAVKPLWSGRPAPDSDIWTGETQAIAYTDASTAATAITVPGRWFRFFAKTGAHIVMGGKSDLAPASATVSDQCYPLPVAAWTDPVYIPNVFDSAGTGGGTLYIRIIRSATTNGTLYIAAALPSSTSRENVSVHWPTSTSTTT